MESPADRYWKSAQVFLAQNRFDLAESWLRKALGDNPHHPLAPGALAWALLRQNRTDEALEQAREAIRLRPDYAYAHYVAAIAAGDRENFDSALEHGREAVRLKPELVTYRRVLPGLHLVREQYAEVVRTAEEGLALNGTDPVLQRLRAIGLAGLGRATEARQGVIEFLRSAPNDPHAQVCAGNVYRRIKDYAAAEAAYRQSMAINPRLASGHGGLGLIRFEQGLFDQAKPFLEQAVAIHDGDILVRRALARIQAKERGE